jgi:hypothetical protein
MAWDNLLLGSDPAVAEREREKEIFKEDALFGSGAIIP